MSAHHFNYDLGPVNLPVKKSEWKSPAMKILSTSMSPSENYGQINIPIKNRTSSNLGPSTIHHAPCVNQVQKSNFYHNGYSQGHRSLILV